MFGKRRKMKELPDELLTEILAKLPLKSLLISTSVCKAWRDLIHGNPCYFSEKQETMGFARFCHEVENRKEFVLITNTEPFFTRDLEPFDDPGRDLGPFDDPGDVDLYGSCNGIICYAPEDLNAALYNPITREHRILPPSLLDIDDYAHAYGLELLGFGFDKSTDDYKVVRLCFDDSEEIEYYVEIYSLSTNCWRKLELKQNVPLELLVNKMIRTPNGVFLNGIVHWVISPHFKVFTFDFATEEFGEMEFPCYESNVCRWPCSYVTIVDDSLAVASKKSNGNNIDHGWGIDVWVMLEYGNKESWTRRFSVTLPCLKKYEPVVNICWVSDNNELVVVTDYGELLIYSGNDDLPRTIQPPYDQEDCFMLDGSVFRPSLIPLPINTSHDLL